MVTIVEKISIIIDVDLLFNLNNPNVQAMINKDSYRIDELYKESLNIFRENKEYKFKHLMSNETMTLNEWMKYYQCNISDPKQIGIFLRIAEPILI